MTSPIYVADRTCAVISFILASIGLTIRLLTVSSFTSIHFLHCSGLINEGQYMKDSLVVNYFLQICWHVGFNAGELPPTCSSFEFDSSEDFWSYISFHIYYLIKVGAFPDLL